MHVINESRTILLQEPLAGMFPYNTNYYCSGKNDYILSILVQTHIAIMV